MFETSTLETLYGGQLTLNSVKKKKKSMWVFAHHAWSPALEADCLVLIASVL